MCDFCASCRIGRGRGFVVLPAALFSALGSPGQVPGARMPDCWRKIGSTGQRGGGNLVLRRSRAPALGIARQGAGARQLFPPSSLTSRLLGVRAS